jgi:dihydrofolate reductase
MDKKIRLIASISDNNVIGINNKFSTFQTGQMKMFRDITLKTPVIMGRKTQDYIQFPLDERVCITISKFNNRVIDGFVHAKSLKHALSIANIYDSQTISIIGGQSIFEQSLIFADEILLIEVYTSKDGDRFFPELNFFEWKFNKRIYYKADQDNEFPYSLVSFTRRLK